MRKYVFWGVLFIIMGSLWMLKMSNVISFTCRNILSLWPLILIWIGIGMLPLKEGYKIALDMIFMAIGIVLLLQPVQCCSFSQHIDSNTHVNSVITGNVVLHADDSDKAKLYFNAGATEIIFAKGDTALLNIVAADIDNEANITLARRQNNNKAEIDVKVLPKPDHVMSGPYTVLLSPNPVWDMEIEVGATKNHIDLSAFKVEKLELSSGASKVYLKIGDLYPNVDIEIDLGVTSMEIAIPSTMNCNIEKESGLTSSSFKDFKEIEKGHYYSAATNGVSKGTINLEISAGVSNIVVTKY
jgi:hypothetical protein